MSRTVIHVNQHVIRANGKTGARNPTLTVKQGRSNRYAREVIIEGPSRVVYSPDAPLSCGARVWIETDAPVTLVGEANVPGRTVTGVTPCAPVTDPLPPQRE